MHSTEAWAEYYRFYSNKKEDEKVWKNLDCEYCSHVECVEESGVCNVCKKEHGKLNSKNTVCENTEIFKGVK